MMMQDQTGIDPRNAPIEDERRERRRKVLKGGTIRFNGGYGAMQCRLRNVTSCGALLEFGETLGVPAHFDLQVGGEPASRRARAVWRDSTRVGIAFEAA